MSQIQKMRVAIVGAGPAGLCSLKHMLCHHAEKFEPVAFERGSQLGGQWVHSDDTTQTPLQSAVYDNLRCNIPKDMMGFPEFPFPDEVPDYVHHTDFLKYLESYADYFMLHSHIKLSTEVTQIHPAPNSSSLLDGGWEVKTKNLVTGEITEEFFDAVLVCNGHYAVPHMTVNGTSNFKGTLMHSQKYRNPKQFQSQNVLIVGGSLSGVDIALEVASFADKVYMSQRRRGFVIKPPIGDNITTVASASCVREDGMVALNDGSVLDVDSIILCTGYEYDFPFLSKDCGVKVNDNRVQPLYKHIFNIQHPSMAFIGLHIKVLPLIDIETQVKATVAVYSGVSQLPDTNAMLEDEERDYKERILDCGMLPSDTHDIDKTQWDYYAFLAEMGGFEKYSPIQEKMYHHVNMMRKTDVTTYKKYRCVVIDWDKCLFTFVLDHRQ